MATPELSDIDGNGPDMASLQRLARYPSLAQRGFLRSMGEGILNPGEDARLIFVRGTFYRREVIQTMLGDMRFSDFTLEAEPANEADPHAVAVLMNGEKVGYIPREIAPDLQPLVLLRNCRAAARGCLQREGDSFALAVLVAWQT